jgi:hypothetical protein
MEIGSAVIIVLGLLILGWYQKSRIVALGKDLASQKEVLDRLKVYFDIFDPEQLQRWVKNKEETTKREHDSEIQELRSLMQGLVAERFETGKWVEREVIASTDLIIRLLFYASPRVREESMAKMPNSMFKDAVRMVVNRMPEYCQVLAAGQSSADEDQAETKA